MRRGSQFSAGFSAVLEACAAGRAVIASDTAGMREIVQHGETGLLVPTGDVQALRQAIERLWTLPDLAKEMGLAARQFVETYYNQDRAHQSLIDAIQGSYRESGRSR
jgi:glycosyltransferase involved in cell wall biosynthesis